MIEGLICRAAFVRISPILSMCCRVGSTVHNSTFIARSLIRGTRILAVGAGCVLGLVAPGWGAPPESSLEERIHALKKSVVAYNTALFVLREDPAAPTPHMEILLDVDDRGDPVPAHHLPSWIRVALDRHPAVDHTYTDNEWHALAEGALQPLLTVPATPGQHTLVVTFKAIDRNGKSYLKTKTWPFETTHPAAHAVVRFRSALNQEPDLRFELAGESLLNARRVDRPADEFAYRLGVFAAQAGDYGNAASFFLSALDRDGLRLRDESRLRLAEAYAAVGLPEEAEAVLTALIGATRDDAMRARAWFQIERIARRDGRHARVLEVYERLGAGLPPELAGEAHTLAGLSALSLRAFPQAADLFRRVARTSPEAPLALYGHAQALAGFGDAFTASELFKRLIQSRSIFDPVRSRVIVHAHAALGLQLIEQGRYDEALAELGQVPADSPAYETALFGVGWALRKADERVKAIAIFQDQLARFPHGTHAHEARLLLAAAYAELRAYTRSVTAYRAALDALTDAMSAVDRRRTGVNAPAWDPLADLQASEPADADPLHRDAPFARAVEQYRWLARFESDLQRTLDHFPPYLTAPRRGATTLGGRLHQSVDGSELILRGQDLLVKLDSAKAESRRALVALALDALASEQTRLEDWSVEASLGIARNLVVERDELGSEVLTLE